MAQGFGEVGLDLLESSDAPHAVQLLTGGGAPELAVIDWHLPGLGGLEVCRLVRARTRPGAPYIILVTPGEQQVGEAFAAGADDCITDTAAPQELQARVFAGRRFAARRLLAR